MRPQKLKVYRRIATADTNAAVIKSGSTELKGWALYGATATAGDNFFVKLYDKATVPDETDAPILTLVLHNRVNHTEEIPGRLVLENGLAIRITGALADNDTTALAAGDMVANIFYD